MFQARYCFFLFLSCLFSCNAYSQVFGGNPPSITWKQINTSSSRVIFPVGLDSVAARITSIISFMNHPAKKTVGSHPQKINIVLQNQTTISNAYVGLGPFRSEFLMTPGQNSFGLGSLPWPDQLTIHEYRHVQQFNSFNVGLSKVMRVLFGEEGQAVANNAAIPDWYYEGDAVFNETILSKQGRGRLPSFFDGYRALWKAGKNYSWMKLRNGSLKDFVPDRYPLGYMLVAYGREKFGDRFWEKVTTDAAAFKNLLYPFQHALKRYSGISYTTFRNEALAAFKNQLEIPETPAGKIEQAPYEDEQFPSFADDGSIIFIKSGYRQIPEFVIRKRNSDHKIRIRDYSIDKYFSYRNGKVVYASYRPDARWGYRDYSDLQVLDITTGRQRTLTRHTKYFSPDISDDGQKIVAVHETAAGTNNLHVLNANTGRLIFSIPNPEKLFYTYPKFHGTHQIISSVRSAEGKMSLAAIDAETGKADYLLPFTFNVTGFPYIVGDTIYFTYSYLKEDELFAYSFSHKKIWRVQSASKTGLGRYHPSVNDSAIVWSSFTANGYQLQETPKDKLQFIEIKPEQLGNVAVNFGIKAINTTGSNILNRVPQDSFPALRYPGSSRILNFHSVEPAISDPRYTLSLISENILNTLQSEFSFTYDRSEKFKKIGFAATYAALFPYLSAGIAYTVDRRILYHGNRIYFNQSEPYAGFHIPLNFSKGRSFTYLNFGSQYTYNQSSFKGNYKDTLGTVSYSYHNSFLSFSHQEQRAKQQLFPRFAQAASLSFKSPFTRYRGYQWMAAIDLYFPGFSKTHSIVFNGAYLAKDSLGQMSFSSGFPFSRGYESANFYRMYKWGFNYHLPLLYPDAGFGNIIYLLRIRANLFYDDTRVRDFYDNGNTYRSQFRTAGTEINFDTKWWNQVNVSFGFRYSYLADRDVYGNNNRNRWEIILPVNILQNGQ